MDISPANPSLIMSSTLHHIPVCELKGKIDALPANQKKQKLSFTEAPPDHARLIQGEWDGWNLRYTFSGLPMRLAFDQQCLHVSGIAARWILKYYLEPYDQEWIQSLLDDFPGATLEFSSFTVPVGVIPSSKTLIWEVRHY